MKRRWRDVPLAFVLLAPSLVIFGIFVFYPLARTAWLGLYQTDFFGGNRQWVGVKQYTDVLGGQDFRHSLLVTALFVLYTVPLGLALGVGLAVLAHKRLKGVGIYRTVFSSTVATSVAVASLMFFVLLHPSIGLLVKILPWDALQTPGLLGRPEWALLAISMTTIWQNLGFIFILMTAGLQSIPEDLYEAARLDGASGWRQFRQLTLPLLGPTLMFGFVVLTIGSFQSFGQIDILTKGGPQDATQVLVYSIYKSAFGTSVNTPVASIMAVALFVIIVALSALQFRLLERRVHYQ